jgi:V8-like Glu-specific endopeptidase
VASDDAVAAGDAGPGGGDDTVAAAGERKDGLPYREQIRNNTALRADDGDAVPKEPPEDYVIGEDDPDSVVAQRYDVDSGEVTEFEVSMDGIGEERLTEGADGELADHPAIGDSEVTDEGAESRLETAGVIGADGRVRIRATESWPWRTDVALRQSYPSGNTFICSATVLDEFHILTAAHCVHDSGEGGWADRIEAYPGRDGSQTPFNVAYATKMTTYRKWTDDRDARFDIAVVALDRSIGRQTGWMGRMARARGNGVYTGTLNTAGYPGDKPGTTMYFDADAGVSATRHNHFYRMDTAGGQSGSPVWAYFPGSGDRYVLTVHAYNGSGRSNPANWGTRLNGAKFRHVEDWRKNDVEEPPRDLADLVDDGVSWAQIRDTSVFFGDDLDVEVDVRNIGTARSGRSDVAFYLSSNRRLGSADTRIGSTSVAGISPFRYRDVSFTGTVPRDLSAGDYYVCWRVDDGDAVREFDESNNEACTDTRVTVEEPEDVPPVEIPVDVVLTDLSNGLQRYNLTVYAPEGSVITSVETGAVSPLQVVAGGPDFSFATVRAADLAQQVGEGEESVVLFTVTVRGERVSAESLSVEATDLTDDRGEPIPPSALALEGQSTSPFDGGVPGVGGDPPGDLNGDGLYEDVDGDGEATFDDAVDLAFADFATINENPAQQAALDFDGSGEVDFGDAIGLAFQV